MHQKSLFAARVCFVSGFAKQPRPSHRKKARCSYHSHRIGSGRARGRLLPLLPIALVVCVVACFVPPGSGRPRPAPVGRDRIPRGNTPWPHRMPGPSPRCCYRRCRRSSRTAGPRSRTAGPRSAPRAPPGRACRPRTGRPPGSRRPAPGEAPPCGSPRSASDRLFRIRPPRRRSPGPVSRPGPPGGGPPWPGRFPRRGSRAPRRGSIRGQRPADGRSRGCPAGPSRPSGGPGRGGGGGRGFRRCRCRRRCCCRCSEGWISRVPTRPGRR
mmetsp:Transcript_108345/g.221195  ORF Transcript_108345/g.221195 Transcript_108345/m.221195 type:complete len:269 (+) Transcript_108345:1135-1941(+)